MVSMSMCTGSTVSVSMIFFSSLFFLPNSSLNSESLDAMIVMEFRTNVRSIGISCSANGGVFPDTIQRPDVV